MSKCRREGLHGDTSTPQKLYAIQQISTSFHVDTNLVLEKKISDMNVFLTGAIYPFPYVRKQICCFLIQEFIHYIDVIFGECSYLASIGNIFSFMYQQFNMN